MANIQHHYKSFPLFGSVSAAEDMTCKQTVWTIGDISRKGLTPLISISHVFRNDSDGDHSQYYGKNFSLSLHQRLVTQSGSLYYIDALGDKHEVVNNKVLGMSYTTETPAWISEKTLFAAKNFGNLRWLTSGNSVLGFNSNGYLIFVSDEKRKLYYLYRVQGSNLLKAIHDYTGTEIKYLFDFYYNDYDEYNNYHLIKIIDFNSKDYVSFEYDSDSYSNANLTKIIISNGPTYDISYDSTGYLSEIKSSDGYKASYNKTGNTSTVSVRSTLSKIPGGTAAENNSAIAEWTISYSGSNCTITDIDGDKEYYVFTNSYKDVQFVQEVNGVVVEAQKVHYVPQNEKKVIMADRSCLYKSPYSSFSFVNGEEQYTKLNSSDKPITQTISNRKIAISGSRFNTVEIETDYTYGNGEDSDLCTTQTTYTTYTFYDSNGTATTKKYTQTVNYSYINGILLQKTSKIDNEMGYEEVYTYEEGADGGYTQACAYSMQSDTKSFKREASYDWLGRKVSEKDPTGSITTQYYLSDTNSSYNVSRPGNPFTYHVYDDKDRFNRVYYAEESAGNGTLYVGNMLEYSHDEVAEMKGSDKINFTYDDQRRIKEISIAGNRGTKSISYSQDSGYETTIVTNENAEKMKCVAGKTNNRYTISYCPAGNTLYETQINVANNADGSLSWIRDYVSSDVVKYLYNSLGQVKEYTDSKTSKEIVREVYDYNKYGDLEKTTITGEVSQTYSYGYEDKFSRRCNSITVGDISIDIERDGYNRTTTKKVTLNGKNLYNKRYTYQSAVNLTNKVITVNNFILGKIKYRLFYHYNQITGQLEEIEYPLKGNSIKYQYTGGKLWREDNGLLNKSQIKYYDCDGNITADIKGNYQPDTSTISDEQLSYTYDGDRLTKFGNEVCEYDNMGNPTTYRGKSATWKGRQMLSFGGNTFTYDGQGRRISKNSLTFFYDSNGNIIKQSNGLEFFYDFEGVVACKHNGNTYIYVTDAQGNIIAIVDSTGDVVVQYWYDAWGNHKVVNANGDEITDQDDIGNLNPFRYRGYYYDTETGLYFLQTRYYDPEVGRFLNRDSVEYADPETINGLNLYAYCLNNPVEYADPTGSDPQWWQWLLFGIGAVLVAASIIALPFTAGGSGLISAIITGAAKGALIGAAVGSGIGIAGGAIYSGVTGSDMGESILSGFLMGFGIGAVVGAVIGGAAGAHGWYNTKALEFTNFGSNEVVLGRSPGYVDIAKSRGATYFHTTDEIWNATKVFKGVGNSGMWKINKAFLKQQIKSGATFVLTESPSGYFYAKEFAYITKHAIYILW